MTANELADLLENTLGYWNHNKQAATMLRQQQAEIESLKTKWLEACDAIIEIGKRTNKSQADIEYEADKAYWRTRTLTNEEIMNEVFRAGLAVSKDTDVFLLEHDVEAFIVFAKAILRKAQEK